MKKKPGNCRIVIPGFRFSGIAAGIKKTGAKDLALIYSETPAVIAGVFTTNRIKAAPVKMSIRQVRKQKGQAIIINSGNANACTGKQGMKDTREMKIQTAKELGISPDFVYVSSTGVIGDPLPMENLRNALPVLVKKLSPSSIRQSASAIMTTDTFSKVYSKKAKIGRKAGTIAGIAKGAGMICPNMATMLCHIVTDIAIKPEALDSALKDAVNISFNRLTIDNDMSTNDTVLAMANGSLGNRPVTKKSADYQKFLNTLKEVTYCLARMIAKDGEGATKLVEIVVKGARTESDAEKVAMSAAGSMLVKTALYGNDPNWGRIMAAIGYSGVNVIEKNIDIYFGRTKLVSRGTGTGKEKDAGNILSGKEITITINLGSGKKSAKVLTCDLTDNYIKINAHYRS